MAVEISVADKLVKLWNLQAVDSQFNEIKILKGELPMEVSDLEDEVEGLDTRIKKLRASVKELELEIAGYNNTIKEADNNIKKYQKQINEVKNDRQYDALTKEIEIAKLDIQLYEKKIRELRVHLDSRKENLDVQEARLAAKRKDLEIKAAELQGIIEKTEKEEEKLRKQSDKASEGIDDRLLKAYNKIRTTYRNGLAVVTVERSSCGGCFNSVPPQIQLEISLHKKVIACEHCGRILVDSAVVAGTVDLVTA